jgi:DNA repair exonuclease SbcCD ATPase subunit
MSYGDYVSTLDLTTLGQCLITGEVIESDIKETYDSANPIPIRKSNGAGKSTIPSVIQWVLFGRTMHSVNPGGKLVNHFTGKDCWAKVEFKNGDSITRTRNLDGTNELIYVLNGDENTITSSTLSTAKNQQKQLARAFNLDWEMFCGSVFFNQYSKPWMEMADQTRKKAIERALHVDRFEYYAKIAKGKLDKIEADVQASKTKVETITEEIARIEASITRLEESASSFEDNKKDRKIEILKRAKRIKTERDEIDLPDLEKLNNKWLVILKINQKLDDYRSEANRIRSAIAELKGHQTSIQRKIDLWNNKSGEICTSCEQTVPADHVSARIEPLQQALEEATTEIEIKQTELGQIRSTIAKTEELVKQKQPDLSTRDAKSIHDDYDSKTRSIKRLKEQAAAIDTEENPHNQSIEDAQQTLTNRREMLAKIEKENKEKIYLSLHYRYVYKAYNDRSKIKSYVFQEHIPYINERIKHYLEVFGLDVKIELTSSLGIASNLWGYEFESGGERKRTDVAFMLAMFDFHEQMYGRQCNILVLDEVDGRLDDDGIDSLINIVKDDLSSKVESVLIISHREMMWDIFPNEIKVVRKDRFSHLRVAI